MKSTLALALLFALPAGAHETLNPATNPDTGYVWFDAPNTTDAGDARIRIVFDGRAGAAALTPNQYWHYAQSYKRHLTALTLRGHVHGAPARARHHAFRDVAARYPQVRVEGFDLKADFGTALLTPDW